MTTRIHHLNCGSMCLGCQRLINGHGSWTQPGRLVCHCLLIETPESLVLVDTGMGTQDIAAPKRRLGRAYLSTFTPKLDLAETAIAQVQALGFDPRDVRHILTTHLDLDHAGGLADFPEATVHVLQPELEQILHPTLRDRLRFRPTQFDHQPKWQVHRQLDDPWFGLDSIHALPKLRTEIRIVPLIGHTKGHMGVAVKGNDTWLLHCGDAYYHHSQITATPNAPLGLALMEHAFKTLPAKHRDSMTRLRQLAREHSDEVQLFCAHDPVELGRYV